MNIILDCPAVLFEAKSSESFLFPEGTRFNVLNITNSQLSRIEKINKKLQLHSPWVLEVIPFLEENVTGVIVYHAEPKLFTIEI